MDSIAVLKATIADLQALLKTLEDAKKDPKDPKVIKKERHTRESFVEHGKKVADDEGWANGCRFPRKTWPLTRDGKEFAKLQDLAKDLGLECEKGTNGSEIYVCFTSHSH